MNFVSRLELSPQVDGCASKHTLVLRRCTVIDAAKAETRAGLCQFRASSRPARSPTRRWSWQSLRKSISGRQNGSSAATSHGIAAHEVLVLNALRRLLDLGPAMLHTIAGWSGFSTTQALPGATLPQQPVRKATIPMHSDVEPCFA